MKHFFDIRPLEFSGKTAAAAPTLAPAAPAATAPAVHPTPAPHAEGAAHPPRVVPGGMHHPRPADDDAKVSQTKYQNQFCSNLC